MFARIERFDAAIERFLALVHAAFRRAHLAQTLLAFSLGLLLHLQNLVLGLHDCFATKRIGLALRVVDSAAFFVEEFATKRVMMKPAATPTTSPSTSQNASEADIGFPFLKRMNTTCLPCMRDAREA